MSSAAGYGPLTDRVEIDPNKPQAFLSYARDDDRFLGGAISRLRVDIEEAVGFVSARPFRIFQDTDGIGFGQDWLDRLEEALRQARFLIPILTPRYFASGPCRAEAFRFLEYEAAAGRNDLILPIYLQDTPLVENAEQVAADDLARRFAERQRRDWRHLAFEQAGSSRLKAEATKLAREISDAAARAVPRPVRRQPTPPDEQDALKAELDKLKQTVEAERGRNHELQAALSEREQEAKQLAEERAVFEGRAEEATTLKRELDALRQFPNVSSDSVEQQQPVQQSAGFRPSYAFGIAGLALLIGGSTGWLLKNGDTSSDASSATIEEMRQQIEELRGQVNDKTAEAAGFEDQLKALKGAGDDRDRITALTDEIDSLKGRLEASEQQAAAREDELNGMRWALAEAQTALAKRNSQAVSTEQYGETFRDCSECPEMVVIPAGEFLMGSPEGEGLDWERPQHRVTINTPFALGKYEVTFDEWDACLAAGGCEHEPDDRGWGRGDRPVMNVSWEDVKQYCGWLAKKTDQNYRLPSEAEWEYAARAGTETAYFWGNEVGKNQANCDGCGSEWDDKETAPVGRFAANPFGLYDMHGNVWEWVEDTWHRSYQNAPTGGSAWIDAASGFRVLRGGSWVHDAQSARSAFRGWNAPGNRGVSLGFRCARGRE